MPTPLDPKRLPALRAALETLGEDDIMSQHQLADLYGVTNARMSTLIKTRFQGFPEPERHQDKTHWFKARPAVQAMIAYLTKSGAKKKRLAAATAAVMGRAQAAAEAAEPEEEEAAPLGPAELNQLASAATRIWNLAVAKKDYILATDVRHDVRGMLEIVKREIHGLPNAIDPNGEFSPLQRARMEQRCRDMLTKIHRGLSAYLIADADG